MNQLTTTHKLDFESGQATNPFGELEHRFRIGTCTGQWGVVTDGYFILSVINSEPGNGHLDDVFEWFEHSCKRDNRNLFVLEIFNEKFYLHLLSKRGFKPLDTDGDNVVKIFNQKAYKHLRKNGNEILKKGSLKCI